MAKKKNNKKAAPAVKVDTVPTPKAPEVEIMAPIQNEEATGEASKSAIEPLNVREADQESTEFEHTSKTETMTENEDSPKDPQPTPEVNHEQTSTENTNCETVNDEKRIDDSQAQTASEEPAITNESKGVEPVPDNVPTAAPAPRKRMTLQERLALAAKSKKSSKRSASSPSVTAAKELRSRTGSPEPQEDTDNTSANASTPIVYSIPTREPSVDLPASNASHLATPSLKDVPVEDLHRIIGEMQNKFIVLESKTKSLTEEKHSLQEKIKSLTSAAPKLAPSAPVNAQVLKEKDDKIAQLLKEGEELSLKELKFNNTIKKLKAKESENEYEIEELLKRVSTLEGENKKLRESLKKSQESDQQATNKSKLLQKQLDHEKDALKEEIGRNEEVTHKLEELSQTLVQEKNKFSKEVNDLKRQVEKEKQKFVLAKEEHGREVARLEDKVEQLRFQAENAQTATSSNDEGYLKLLKQYDILQKQYTSATENWQSIEASLMGKISALENEISDLQSKLASSEKKVSVLSKDLAENITQLESANGEVKAFKAEHTKAIAKLETITKALEQAEETLETKEIKFNQERTTLEYKLQAVERQLKDTIQPQHLTVDTSSGFPSPLFSRNTSTPSFKQRPWESKDISLGESSTTPIQSRKTSTAHLSQGYFDEREDPLSDFDENESTGSPVSNFNTSRQDTYSNIAVGGGASVQLIGKMSSQVRRLHTEISTMREEIDKLTEDKKAANEEIVRLMKDNEQVDSFKSRIAELEREVEGYSSKHNKMLEILGEKSERVEELKADVEDLKDLCKQQVQQMVELQAK